MRHLPFIAHIFLLLIIPVLLTAQEKSDADKPATTFTFGGYAKLDLIFSRFGSGSPDVTSPVRDMYLPSVIPVGDGRAGYDTQIHAKESRFNVEVASELLDRPIRGFVEMDFLLSRAGDQRVSNSYNPRLRHFYFAWGKWLFGQTWTNFMTTKAIPDGIIFLPGGEGLIFNRQAQARFTHKNWSFSIENPETTVTPFSDGSTYNITSGGLPDPVIKYTHNGTNHVLAFAAIYRLLLNEDDDADRHTAAGYGFNASGVLHADRRDVFRFMVTYGAGLGRYIAFAYTNAAVLDQDDEVNPVRTASGVISLTHHWSDTWRTSLHGSFLVANDNSELTSGTASKSVFSASASLLYTPHPQLLFGVQVLGAWRELEDGTRGNIGRFQFSAKYMLQYQATHEAG
jgi:hypothetical protein